MRKLAFLLGFKMKSTNVENVLQKLAKRANSHLSDSQMSDSHLSDSQMSDSQLSEFPFERFPYERILLYFSNVRDFKDLELAKKSFECLVIIT